MASGGKELNQLAPYPS
jgi:hypothetical protein